MHGGRTVVHGGGGGGGISQGPAPTPPTTKTRPGGSVEGTCRTWRMPCGGGVRDGPTRMCTAALPLCTGNAAHALRGQAATPRVPSSPRYLPPQAPSPLRYLPPLVPTFGGWVPRDVGFRGVARGSPSCAVRGGVLRGRSIQPAPPCIPPPPKRPPPPCPPACCSFRQPSSNILFCFLGLRDAFPCTCLTPLPRAGLEACKNWCLTEAQGCGGFEFEVQSNTCSYYSPPSLPLRPHPPPLAPPWLRDAGLVRRPSVTTGRGPRRAVPKRADSLYYHFLLFIIIFCLGAALQFWGRLQPTAVGWRPTAVSYSSRSISVGALVDPQITRAGGFPSFLT